MLPKCRESDDVFKDLVGEHIATGKSRAVYKVKDNPNYVIKEALEGRACINENEAKFYYSAKDEGHNCVIACIAEVHSISQSGKYLIMERLCTCDNLIIGNHCDIPVELVDIHHGNFGIKNGIIKCLDYGGAIVEEKISGLTKPHDFPSNVSTDDMRRLRDIFDSD